ncbi:MAG: hypothetical protein O7G84_13540 [Gammaproteobacteria bacterium]|nr:hypothetical protein [Gammaproteobacteria bacterium]
MPIDGNMANGPDSVTELHNAYLEGKHDGFNQGLASGRAEMAAEVREMVRPEMERCKEMVALQEFHTPFAEAILTVLDELLSNLPETD